MKRIKIGGVATALFLATSSWASSLEVTDVKIAQRYPWNGLVDITYTVKSDDATKDVWVYPVGYDADTATSVALMPQYLSGEGASNAVHQGTHRMTWDMAAQMGKGYNRAAFSVKLHAYWNASPWMVIDISEGRSAKSYPVTYLAEPPEGGWTKEYEESKIAFRLIPPRSFSVGGNRITLTQPFYCAVYPLSTNQLSLIWRSNYSGKEYDMSYNNLRGKTLGAQWPKFQQVDGDSILAKLRIKTGMTH